MRSAFVPWRRRKLHACNQEIFGGSGTQHGSVELQPYVVQAAPTKMSGVVLLPRGIEMTCSFAKDPLSLWLTGCSQLSCTDFDYWQPIYKKYEFCRHFVTQGSHSTPWHHIWLLPWWHWASPCYSACPRTPPDPAAQVYYCFPSSYFLNWASLTQHPSTFPNAI